MSEKVTDADRAAANTLCRAIMTRQGTYALEENSISQHFASHRIAAAKAERERCVAAIRDRYAELPLQLQRSSHGHLLIKLADELAKEIQ